VWRGNYAFYGTSKTGSITVEPATLTTVKVCARGEDRANKGQEAAGTNAKKRDGDPLTTGPW